MAVDVDITSLGRVVPTFSSSPLGAAGSVVSNGLGMYKDIENLLHVEDTDRYIDKSEMAINDVVGNIPTSFDQWLSQYEGLNQYKTKVDADSLYNKGAGQIASGIGSLALQGASIGTSISPGWGTAAIGALVGGIGGGIATVIGKNNAKKEADDANAQIAANVNEARERSIYNLDNYNERSSRQKQANLSADGGEVERKQVSLADFASQVLSNKQRNDITHSAGIVRRHCNGGTMIRIKR